MRPSTPEGILLVLAMAHTCALAQEPVTVTVIDCANAPPAVMRTAVATARNAFALTQGNFRWVIGNRGQCDEPQPNSNFEVLVMPRLRGPLNARGEVRAAGYVMPTGFDRPRAYAFLDAARTAAERTTRPVDEVLGCILIHEVGHLLGLGHQPHGAMRAQLEGLEMDRATSGRAFTGEEARQLRLALSRLGIARIAGKGGNSGAPGGLVISGLDLTEPKE